MAAWALRGRPGVQMLDAGHTAAGLTSVGLEHLRAGAPPVSLKLRGPAVEFITRDAARLTPVVSASFPAVVSLAKGGLGNAWGGGVYRFRDGELGGLPDLTPHYDAVSRHIGVCGANDDLGAEFGLEPELLPPLRIGRNARAMLENYKRARPAGVTLGHARLAVRSGEYTYRANEFTSAGDPARYCPASTLDSLPGLTYSPGWVARRFRETEAGVEVEAVGLQGGCETFRARRLILAAGTLNTARIVLRSFDDFATRLPLLDNPITALPLVRWSGVGRGDDAPESGMAQLNIVLAAERFGRKFQGSLYGTRGAPPIEFAHRLPFSLTTNLRVLRALLPAVTLAMVFHPAAPGAQYLRLRPDGALEADYPWRADDALTLELVRVFRSLGFWAHAGMAHHAGPGQGIHYAGTLPMTERPGRYQLHRDGRLEGTRAVYVCDGSCFSHLPAKNLTFTIMANAHRIASGLR